MPNISPQISRYFDSLEIGDIVILSTEILNIAVIFIVLQFLRLRQGRMKGRKNQLYC